MLVKFTWEGWNVTETINSPNSPKFTVGLFVLETKRAPLDFFFLVRKANMADTGDQQQHTCEDNTEAADGMGIDNVHAEVEEASNSKAEGNGVEAGNELGAKNITGVKKKRGRKPKINSLSTGGLTVLAPGETSAKKVTKLSTPVSKRPARQKKSVDRFIASIVSGKVRELVIEKGNGTPLKDIPNVVYKLSKRSRADDTLKILHSVLYGKRVKAFHVKSNILQFSGFVWGEHKDRGKVKEKLEKLHKDILANLCDVLDLHFSKTANKKEELVTKLIEFLEAPRITTDILIEEKEQKLKLKNRKRGKKTLGRTPVKGARKRRKMISGSFKEEGKTKEVEEYEDESVRDHEQEEDKDEAIEEEPEKENADSESGEEEDDDDEDYRAKRKGSKTSAKKGSTRRVNEDRVAKKENEAEGKLHRKAPKSPSKGIPEKSRRVKSEENVGKDENEAEEDKHTPGKDLERTTKGAGKTETIKSGEHLVKEEGTTYEDRAPAQRSPSKGTTVRFRDHEGDTEIAVSSAYDSPSSISRKNRKEINDSGKPSSALGKKQSKKQANETVELPVEGEGKHPGPTNEEIQSAIAEFLNEVDFNTATLSDIVNRLGERFDLDFTRRKADVKAMIEEELTKFIEEEEDEEN